MSDHYFTARPSATSAPRQVRLALRDVQVGLTTDAGVFSPTAVDAGTLVLLESVPPPPATGDLLDLGCGYGPITITLARRAPGATVWGVDVNERARELARVNAANAGCDGVRIEAPDDVPDDVRFAAIWSNPPIKVGKATLHGMLQRWLPRLAPGGVAHLVVQRHLGADSLQRWLESEGFPTERLASRKGYRILAVRTEDTT
ncbi:class I SAM-dependent methyltransferase [Cryptosporangium aurantiacum]|uniref:Methyltransferase small domain-containing protein n=1 Tax=Cryptosporangium aurantiacum TaxID=134849 RepID=A0A1M7I1I3_9ACTN|nr:methyltransferase [Cryptosporangium aurantiacum]SHM34433.1 Methyltransferase small domain-containing protein [Cryptosporangium aurantiacum]